MAEPTSCRAVLGHRGFLSVKTWFSGVSGHSSEARALEDNANHRMARWAARALEVAEGRRQSPDDPGSCFNIGIAEGGTKSNVIAGKAFVHSSARLCPGDSSQAFLDDIRACAGQDPGVEWEVPFLGDPLPASGQNEASARSFCERRGLPIGDPVDFWTEASVFSAGGFPALVLGPGDIEQAHVSDEWVAVEQLEQAYSLYASVVSGNG